MAVILAGGSGERFWPLSRPDRPKQLLKITNSEKTMLEEAVQRVVPLFGEGNVFVATGKALGHAIADAGVVRAENLLVEPAKRNTFGAICWIVASLLARFPSDGLQIAILTSDHKITDEEAFRADVSAALELSAAQRGIAIIGIPPTRAETGFGYVEVDGIKAKRFREKPDQATANQYLASGNFLWNSGMFFFSPETLMDQLLTINPEWHRGVTRLVNALEKGEDASEAFEDLPSISFDFAVMEKSTKVFVLPASFGWDDVGAWDSLERTLPVDENGNVTIGKVEQIDCSQTIVYNDSSAVCIGMIGVSDLIVVATDDGILICPKSEAQRVREIAQRMSES